MLKKIIERSQSQEESKLYSVENIAETESVYVQQEADVSIVEQNNLLSRTYIAGLDLGSIDSILEPLDFDI